MRSALIAIVALASAAFAQNCGPQYGNQVCAANTCCSQYGWCDTTAAHCDPATCLKNFSGVGSSCRGTTNPQPNPTTLSTSAQPPASTFPATVPVIDVCGTGSGGVSCPGAGLNGYFYRCCSSAGHCGPKNDIQDQSIYCGAGCQGGFGKCNTMAKPPQPAGNPGTAGAGETCGPIVNKKCATGLCCSGSNFCGTTADFCGAANWCQPGWGRCN
ncbi:chitin binding protein 6 [Dendryphion nanum]|uniref:Chitin binding protein 6 n=1 Tax=Dendryphion nanum TaxID=256645 RepID=A0A9P9DCY1_9PLEO|nr:chitin binding protein 6 [Dendryphion nanum]